MYFNSRLFGALAACGAIAASVILFARPTAAAEQDKYALKVPGGLAFAEFKGYESWETVAVSASETAIAVTVAGNACGA